MAKLPFDTFMEVVWDDAVSNDGWVSVDEDAQPERIVSRGWLIKETSSYLLLAGALYERHGNTIGSTQTIPTGMIVSRRKLKVSNASSKLRHKVHPQPDPKEVHREPGEG